MSWYQSSLGECIGYAILAIGIGLGTGSCYHIQNINPTNLKAEEIRASAQIETQRLRTIEEAIRTYGYKINSQELSDFLKTNNIEKAEKK